MPVSVATQLLFTCLAFLSLTGTSHAQEDTVFAAIAFVRTGERDPIVESLNNVSSLTGFGAQQMQILGNTFRQRYINRNSSSRIQGISTDDIDNTATYFLALDQQFALASAQSFTLGLYPPYTLEDDPRSMLSNGASEDYPLNGYQYPWIQTVGLNDARSIYIAGGQTCNNFYTADNGFGSSPEYDALNTQSETLYQRVGNALGRDTLPSEAYGPEDAYLVYDYVNFLYNHDADAYADLLNGSLVGDLQQLHAWANLQQWGEYGYGGNSSMRSVAGKTWASGAASSLLDVLNNGGAANTLQVSFGEGDPMLSFASLTGLSDVNPDFQSLPNYASAMVLELFSNNVTSLTGETADIYNLKARFLYLNGTDQYDQPMPQEFTIYPLFGLPDARMEFEDVINNLASFNIISTSDWCSACDSWNATQFCLAYNGSYGLDDSGLSNGFKSQMSPTLAGAVGAVVTLAALCIFMVIAVGCCGMTCVRRTKKNQSTATAPAAPGGLQGSKKESKIAGGLRGFKGRNGHASDPDLEDASPVSPQSNNGQGVTYGNGDHAVMGHERDGSWELKEPKRVATQARPQNPFDDDEVWAEHALGKEVHPVERL